MAVCPFLERIPISQHAEFMDDVIEVVISMNLQQHLSRDSETVELGRGFVSPYKLVVAYAQKSSNLLLHSMLSDGLIDVNSKEKGV